MTEANIWTTTTDSITLRHQLDSFDAPKLHLHPPGAENLLSDRLPKQRSDNSICRGIHHFLHSVVLVMNIIADPGEG